MADWMIKFHEGICDTGTIQSKLLNNLVRFFHENVEFRTVIEIYGKIELTVDRGVTRHFEIPRLLAEVIEDEKELDNEDDASSSSDSSSNDNLFHQPLASIEKPKTPRRVTKRKQSKTKKVTDTKELFKCNVCAYSTYSLPEYKSHSSLEHNIHEPFNCSLCVQAFATAKGLKHHISISHIDTDRSKYKCRKCNYSCPKESTLNAHVLYVHGAGVGDLRCTECNYMCKTQNRLDRHGVIAHKKKDAFYCNHCNFSAALGAVFKTHLIKVHGGAGLVKCGKCSKLFLNSRTLLKHLKEVHHNVNKIFKCDLCPFKSNRAYHITVHVKRKHQAWKKYKCDMCGFCATNLHRHKRLHDVSRQFVCSECSYRFPSETSLKSHMTKFHSGQAYLDCYECDRKFVNHTALRQHSNEVHGNKISFQCLECDFNTVVAANFQKHCNEIHGNRYPFQCNKCTNKYHRIFNLKRHIISHKENPCKKRKSSKVICHWPCNACEYIGNDSVDLKNRASVLHKNETPFLCEICGNIYAFARGLRRHNMSDHQPNCGPLTDSDSNDTNKCKEKKSEKPRKVSPLACKLCDFKGINSSELKEHAFTVHKDEKPFECKICGKCFSLLQGLSRHKKSQHEHPCSLCKEVFTTVKDLNEHSKATGHANIIPGQLCEHCEMFFETKVELIRHRAREHDTASASSTGPYTCNICSKTFKAIASYNVHLRNSHSNGDEIKKSKSEVFSEIADKQHKSDNVIASSTEDGVKADVVSLDELKKDTAVIKKTNDVVKDNTTDGEIAKDSVINNTVDGITTKVVGVEEESVVASTTTVGGEVEVNKKAEDAVHAIVSATAEIKKGTVIVYRTTKGGVKKCTAVPVAFTSKFVVPKDTASKDGVKMFIATNRGLVKMDAGATQTNKDSVLKVRKDASSVPIHKDTGQVEKYSVVSSIANGEIKKETTNCILINASRVGKNKDTDVIKKDVVTSTSKDSGVVHTENTVVKKIYRIPVYTSVLKNTQP